MSEDDSDKLRQSKCASCLGREHLTSTTNLGWTYFMRGWKSATRSDCAGGLRIRTNSYVGTWMVCTNSHEERLRGRLTPMSMEGFGSYQENTSEAPRGMRCLRSSGK